MALSIAEMFLFQFSPRTRGLLLFFVVCVLSFIFEKPLNNDWFLAERNNLVNLYLVKWGWGWTFYPVGAFLLTGAFVVEGKLSLGSSLSILARLMAGTAVWYFWVENVFPFVENKTGLCTASTYPDKRSCGRAGYWWTGFDSSGHCFLLLWNTLFIREELSLYKSIKQYRSWREENGDFCLKERRRGTGGGGEGNVRLTTTDDIQVISDRVEKWFSVLEWQFVFISLLTMVWELMLVSTAIHFHTPGEKIVGCVCALISWFIIYRCLGFERKTASLAFSNTSSSGGVKKDK